MPGILAGEHGCDDLLQAVPFVREDVQRIASGSATDHAVVALAPWFGSGTPAVDVRAAAGLPTPPRTPDAIVLRI